MADLHAKVWRFFWLVACFDPNWPLLSVRHPNFQFRHLQIS